MDATCSIKIYFGSGSVLLDPVVYLSILDPSSLVAGDMATVHYTVGRRASQGRGRIFTGTSARLDKPGSAMSTLSPPTVTSTRMVM